MDQVNSLREIQALRRLNPHPNIIDLEEVLYDKGSGRLALVFELMDQNVYELIRGRKQPVKGATVKLLMYQLLKAVARMHNSGIFHRDIKPEVRPARRTQHNNRGRKGTGLDDSPIGFFRLLPFPGLTPPPPCRATEHSSRR